MTAADNMTKRRLNWGAPASEANPEYTAHRTLREHIRILVEGGRDRKALAEGLGINVASLNGAIKREGKAGRRTKSSAAPAAAPAEDQPADPAVGLADTFGADQPALAANADWVSARDLVAAADKDELAEFFSAYGLTDRFEAFVVGLRRGKRLTAPAA